MAVLRPLKTSGTRTFVDERIAGYPIIEAAEVDAEFDNLVTAVNTGNVVVPPLADLSVTTAKLADLSVTTGKLADNAVTTAKLADLQVTDGKIAGVSWSKVSGAPTTLPPNGAAGGDLAGSTYPNPVIAPFVITRSKLNGALQQSIPPPPDDPFDTNKVATAVGGIAVWAPIPPQPVADGAVSTPKLVDGAVTTAKILDGAVTDAKITSVAYTKVTGHPTEYLTMNGSVTTIKLADLAVTNAKLADEAVLLRNIDQDSVPLPPVVNHGNLGQILGCIEVGTPNVPTIAWVDPATYLSGGGGGGGPPSGAAGGDLVGSTYPDPLIAPGRVTRAKTASDCWLPPIPTGTDVAKVLTVAAGPTLAWATPTGGGSTGVVIGPSAPASPTVGQLWWRTTDGNLYVYYDDGSSAQFVPAMASVGKLVGGQFYLIAGALAGVPTASLSLGLYVAALAYTLPIGLTGSQASARVAATAQTDLTVKVNGVSKGTIRFAVGATVATFIWTSAVAIAVGDRIEIVAVSGPDDAPADIAWTLKGAL